MQIPQQLLKQIPKAVKGFAGVTAFMTMIGFMGQHFFVFKTDFMELKTVCSVLDSRVEQQDEQLDRLYDHIKFIEGYIVGPTRPIE